MATRVLRFEVEEAGAVVLVEVDDDAAVGPVSRGGVPERARQTFEAAIAQIRPAIEIVTRQVRELTTQPDQVSVEFGVKLTAGADALIARTAVEGNLKLTLVWKGKGSA